MFYGFFAVKTAFLVRVTGFEPAKSLAPKASAIPNFATPGYEIMSFHSCGQLCGQAPFHGDFCGEGERENA